MQKEEEKFTLGKRIVKKEKREHLSSHALEHYEYSPIKIQKVYFSDTKYVLTFHNKQTNLVLPISYLKTGSNG